MTTKQTKALQLEQVIKERDEAEDYIDVLLDEVLGIDRPEWSSAYGRNDALDEVRDRITALHAPQVDRAWQRFEHAIAAAPQLPVAGGARMNVIKLAQEAGMRWEGGFTRVIECVTEAELTHFAELVRNAVLEEAAGVCIETGSTKGSCDAAFDIADACAAAIRAMKEQA